MTIFTITDCSNDCQLQDFITRATNGDTITFACSGTIALTSTLIIKAKGKIGGNLTLDGSGESVILDGDNHLRVLLVDSMHLTLKGLTLTSGNTDESGGGLFISRSSEVTIDNATISGNRARHGGGLFNDGGKFTMTNCTVSGNTASAWGGGLYNNFGGEATISFSTFVKNTASVAGGWAAGSGPFRVRATIVANNTAKRSSRQNGCGQITSPGPVGLTLALIFFSSLPGAAHSLAEALSEISIAYPHSPIVRRAHALIAHSQLAILPECGHWVQRDDPQAFLQA
jgi:hypothetical protein